MNIWIALSVFVAYTLVDAMHAFYIIKIQKRQAFQAASIGAIMYVLLAVGVISYTDNILYLIPMIIGSFLGTYAVIKFQPKKLEDQEAGTPTKEQV